MRKRVASLLKSVLVPALPPPEKDWPLRLEGKVAIGERTKLADARLTVRDPRGCSLSVGSHCNIEASIVFERQGAAIVIGSRTHIGGGTLLDAACKITIGDDVLIAFDVVVMDHDSHSLLFRERQHDVENWIRGEKNWRHVKTSPVTIGDKAWIGVRAIILEGVSIGEGSIVGAGSIVTRDVPDWTIVAGNPAKVIRSLSEEERRLD